MGVLNEKRCKSFLKNKYKKTKKYLNRKYTKFFNSNFNKYNYTLKEYIDSLHVHVSNNIQIILGKILKTLTENNLNNNKFSELIIKKLKDEKIIHENVVNNTVFINKIKNMVIIKDWSILDNIIPPIPNHLSYKYKFVIDHLYALEKRNILIFIFPTNDYRTSGTLLVKPCQKVYNELYPSVAIAR
jgi:hypothetical protein